MPEEEDRLGTGESKQVDELLNYEDPTSRPRPPPPVEVSTEPPRELEEPSRDDLDIGMDAGHVVCLSTRKTVEKLKSFCSLSRLHVLLSKEQEKQRHQPGTKAVPCPLRMRQAPGES